MKHVLYGRLVIHGAADITEACSIASGMLQAVAQHRLYALPPGVDLEGSDLRMMESWEEEAEVRQDIGLAVPLDD